MKKHKTPAPTPHPYSVLRQFCNYIPAFLVPKLAHATKVDEQARTFSPWSHDVALLFAQLTHAIGLNDVCDALRLYSGPLSALRGATPPSRNNLSYANQQRDASLAEQLFWAVLDHLKALHPRFAGSRKGKRLLYRFKRTIHAVDSTTIQLVASCLDWAKHRRRKAAAKCHLRLDLPVQPYDCAVVRPISANGCCHVLFDTNRYSVPPLCASQKLTLKLYPDQLLLFHHAKLIATHVRTYDRRQKITQPDHTQELLAQRKQARTQSLLLTILALSPHAEAYARKLEDKRLNSPHHLQKTVALSEIYGPQKVARALQDALTFEAYGCEYIANILEQRERPTAQPGALHLTRRADLLDLELPPADLTPYEPKANP